ncbi:hypothetical protein BGZ73_006289 [Actinomortierella ambigua]|nr:hypothetical protein BGZ73_006289 [Actinomortierella ambigua]
MFNPLTLARMMRTRFSGALFLLAILIALVAPVVHALDEAQAGVIDWHHRWIGTPRLTAIPKTVRGAPHVFVATEKNVVAAVRARTGELIWRQMFREEEEIHVIRPINGNLFVLSGSDKTNVRMLDGKTGQPIWDFAPAGEPAYSVNGFGQAATVTVEDGNIIVINQGIHVRKLNANVGTPVWHWSIEEGSPTSFIAAVEAKGFGKHDSVLYIIGLNRGIAAFSLEVAVLDSNTGEHIKTFNIKSAILRHEDVQVLGGGTFEKTGYVAWLETDKKQLATLKLGSDRVNHQSYKSILDEASGFDMMVGQLEFESLGPLEGRTAFVLSAAVGEYHDAKSAILLEIDEKTNKAEVTFDFREQPGFSAFSVAYKPSSQDLVVLRAYRAEVETGVLELVDVAKHETIVQHEFDLAHDKFGHFTTAALELFNKGQEQYRVTFTTADGSFHSYSDSERWYREESLAYATHAELVDLPERKMWTQEADELLQDKKAAEGQLSLMDRYTLRLTKHISQLKDLPQFIISYANPSSLFQKPPKAARYSEVEIGAANRTLSPLYRDQFGIRKLLIMSTGKGKLVAMDTANKGQIVWSRLFNQGHDIKHVFTVRSANVRLPPLIAVVAQTSDGSGGHLIRMYRLNALTGEDYESENHFFPASSWIPAAYKNAIKLPLEDSDERTQVIVIADERMHLTTFPTSIDVQEQFKNFADDFYFLLDKKIGAKSLQGYKAIVSADLERMDVEPTWTLNFPEGEEIVAFAERPNYEVMASLGRVLGDRGVLYKYQNPNYVTVITVNAAVAAVPYMTVYLVDIAKGSILFQATHENIGLNQPILATQFENNVVYTFWSEGQSTYDARGYQVASLELYESDVRNDRIKGERFSSFSSQRPHVIAQSFPFPYEAVAIGVTTTKAGISAKDVLFGLARDSVMALNRRWLDPRRPTSTPTAMDKEEMLIPYGPIQADTRMMLSYHLEVAGVRKIVTAPTLLESTTVVVAFGHDLFVTRHAPSKTFDILNEDFSKSQLLLTIVVLLGMLIVTKPMMDKKELKEKWY